MISPSRRALLSVVALSILVSLAGPSRPALAELTFEVVKAFGVPDPHQGAALVTGSDGAFYGTTSQGGASNLGTIFRIDGAGHFIRLHAFSGTDGSSPHAALVLGKDGALYGTAGRTVFKIDSTGAFASLHSFSETDRLWPYPALVLGSDGALYGITHGGSGTVFRIDGLGNFSTVHSFSGADGAYPSSLVVGSDGALYGTSAGGASNMGTIFRVDSAGTFTTLHQFSGSDGSAPTPAPLTLGSDGALYGTTQTGGSAGRGTIFRVDGAGSFTTLHSFAEICIPIPGTSVSECHLDGAAGWAPLVLGRDGALYGAAGTVYRVDGSGNFTVLHSFLSAPFADVPSGSLVLGSDGALYGTTRRDNINYGSFSVFRIDSTGTFTSLSSSDDPTMSPIGFGPLVAGRDGALYATTSSGGAAGLGAFVRIDTPDTYTILHSFRGADGGQQPLAALVAGSDGALYGTTARGGPRDMGTVFRIESTGTFSSLHSFNGTDGAYPTAALLLGSDGALYGTTSGMPTICCDWRRSAIPTIFKIDRAGTFTSLHSFTELLFSGESAALAPGGDGVVYGSTRSEVFKIDNEGTFTLLHSFESESESEWSRSLGTSLVMGSDSMLYGMHTQSDCYPEGSCYPSSTFFQVDGAGNFTSLNSFSDDYGHSALVVGSDGAFYGTASDTIFRIDRAGNLTSFQQEAGSSPSSLVVGADGALYGTTLYGGPSHDGTVFRLDSAGNFTTLHSFAHAEGDNPSALTLGRDGALYGTTSYGGPSGHGTVFRIDSAGAFTPLHAFEYAHGASPFAPLTLGGDCALYGTAAEGGPARGGSVYRIFETGHLCQRIQFDPLPDRVVRDLPFTVTATASSGLPVSFSASGRCSLSGDQVRLKRGVGVCRVTASQAGDSRFGPAEDVVQEFHVLPPRRMQSLKR
jgi:uncharacterized repeat protein (TIGR03803 family)